MSIRNSLVRKPRPMPWRMCRTCHRAGTSTHGACPRTSHPLEGIGACGQCGKRRPLVTCHGYDFRRRSSLSRSSSTASALTRKKKVKASNPKRRQSEFARCFGSKVRVAFVKSLPCAATGILGRESHPVENAHVCDDGTKGTGRRSGYRCIAPLRAVVHHLLHQKPESFRRLFPKFNAERAAADTEAAWQVHCAASTPSRSTTA